MDYPKELSDNLIFRSNLLKKAKDNIDLQDALIAECAKDVLFFTNVFVNTYDPRRKELKDVPFITYPFQDEVMLWDKNIAINQEDNLIEKSRDMGCSWMFVVNDIHDWLFSQQKIEIRWGSRKEDYVDKRGDMDTIFEKFRHIIKFLPYWLLPKGYSDKEHDNHMRLINPETDSSISGESTNANFGRGGRKYRIRFDEFAFWESDQAAWQSAADSTNCRTALSTPNGSSNKFAQLTQNKSIKRKTLHWTLHPEKVKGAYYLNKDQRVEIEDLSHAFAIWQKFRGDLAPEPYIGGIVRSEWYDMECNRRDAKEIAQELDIDYHMSGSPFFDHRKLDKQQEWKYLDRTVFSPEIPYGRYVRINIVQQDHDWKAREHRNGWLKVYEYPKINGQYIVSGDTAEGLEKSDETAGIARDKYTGNVCAVFNGQYTPDDHADKLFEVAKFYNNAKIAPENNNHGYSTCSDLKDMDCDLYWTRKEDPKTGKITPVKAGFTTSTPRRAKALDQMREDIEKQLSELRDADLISQCKTFINNPKGKAEADGSFLDDLVMTYAIGSFVIQEYPYEPPREKKKRQSPRRSPANAGFGYGKG